MFSNCIALNQAGEMLGYASKNNVRFLEYLSHHEEEEAKQRHIPYNPDDTLAIFRQQLEADDYLPGGNQ